MPDQQPAAAANPAQRPATSDQIEWLVTEFGATLYRVAYAIVRDRQVAEDVVQEVLVKAWTSMPEWGGDTPIRWARTVTRNTALSFVRATTARRSTLMQDLESVASPTSTPEDDVVRAESSDQMWRVFAGLGEDERIILMLHEVEGLSYEEIALTLVVSVPAVKSKIYRARRHLRSEVAR